MKEPFKKHWRILFGLSLFWTLFLILRGSPAVTLEYKWKDHLSNISVSRLFIREGAKVFYIPKQDLARPWPENQPVPPQFKNVVPDEPFFEKEGEALHFAWPDVPNPYSPGVYLLYYPLSVLAYDLNLGYYVACILLAFILLVIGHWIFFVFYEHYLPVMKELKTRSQKFWFYLILFFVYCELCRWPMNGQYETIALPFAVASLLSAQNRKWSTALADLGGALFLHPRAMFFAPLTLEWFYRWLREKKFSASEIFKLVCAVAGAASLLWVMIVSIKYQNDPNLFRGINKWGFHTMFTGGHWGRMIFFLAVTAGLAIYFVRVRYYRLALIFIWAQVLMASSASIRQWYVTLLIPFFFLEKPSYRFLILAGLAYFGIAQFTPNNSPFEMTFFKSIIQSLWDPGLRTW